MNSFAQRLVLTQARVNLELAYSSMRWLMGAFDLREDTLEVSYI